MLNNFQRIEACLDIFPFIKSFVGKTIVIKYGGAAMKNNRLKSSVIDDILFLSYLGIKIVLIHGGGPFINTWLYKLNIKPEFINGVRMTNKSTMEVVEMVLAGKVNKDLVSSFNMREGNAVGLSGQDGKLINAYKLFDQKDNYVGAVKNINIKIIDLLLSNNYIPVIATIAADEVGQTYNINADTAAGAIASSLKADKLILLTDIRGIMYNVDEPQSLIKILNITDAQILKDKKVISGGMIPKVNCCIKSLQDGVVATHIIDGGIEHSILFELLTPERIGSMLTL